MNRQYEEPYDPIQIIQHWSWMSQCSAATPTEFQRKFEEIMIRAKGNFIRVRPYGRMGDLKSDGFVLGEGVIFQVYSPEDMKPARLRGKITFDLEGAAEEWEDQLKVWIFVYNERQGIRPDVVKVLDSTISEMKEKYPNIEIQRWSSDHVWKELLRPLPLQDRIEILGPIPGFEGSSLSALEEVDFGKTIRERTLVILQDIMSPINVDDALSALEKINPVATPVHIRPSDESFSIEEMATYQTALIEDLLESSRTTIPKFSISSLAPISLAIHLGYSLSDRVEIELYQYDRDRKTWCWREGVEKPDSEFIVDGIPETTVSEPVEVAIRVSLSADISPEETAIITDDFPVTVDIKVPSPEVMWLSHPMQIESFGKTFRDVLGDIRRLVPNCTKIHLFYAGPTGCAIAAGQAMNPRMNPPFMLYEYDRKKEPRYEPSLRLD